MVNEERRSFLRWGIHALGGLFAALLGFPAFAYLLDPLKRPAPNRDFRTVRGIKKNDLEEGIPLQGTIYDIRHDAWTLHPNDVVGRVWAVLLNGEYKVFTTICPHLGCSINLDPPPGAGFTCPCHGGKFRLDGSLDSAVGQNPAPRGMDFLAFQWVKDRDDPSPDNKNLLQVKYQNFIQGEHEKVVKT